MRVVVTRAAQQAEELAAPLRELGFEVVVLPVIAIGPPTDPKPLRRAAAQCDDYDWIIFTSVNAVQAFAKELHSPTHKPHIAAVGPATRGAAEAHGLRVTVTPDEYVAEALVEALGSEDLRDKRILIPSAAVARDVIPAALRMRGALVEVVEAYRNVLPPEAAVTAQLVFRAPFPDAVLFASSSAVSNLVSLVGEALRNTNIVSIGPATSATVRKHGLSVHAEARPHNAAGLIEACVMMQTSQ